MDKNSLTSVIDSNITKLSIDPNELEEIDNTRSIYIKNNWSTTINGDIVEWSEDSNDIDSDELEEIHSVEKIIDNEISNIDNQKFDEKIIEYIRDYTCCPRHQAINALIECEGDLINSILYIMK